MVVRGGVVVGAVVLGMVVGSGVVLDVRQTCDAMVIRLSVIHSFSQSVSQPVRQSISQ